MDVIYADKRNNSYLDIAYRIYLLNDVLQQTLIHPYYGCRYELRFDLEYNLSFSANNSEDIFQWDWCALYCPDIVSLANVVVVSWALCVQVERG